MVLVFSACALAVVALSSAFTGGRPSSNPVVAEASAAPPESETPEESSPLVEEWKRKEVEKISAERRRNNLSSQLAAVALVGLVIFLVYAACSR